MNFTLDTHRIDIGGVFRLQKRTANYYPLGNW